MTSWDIDMKKMFFILSLVLIVTIAGSCSIAASGFNNVNTETTYLSVRVNQAMSENICLASIDPGSSDEVIVCVVTMLRRVDSVLYEGKEIRTRCIRLGTYTYHDVYDAEHTVLAYVSCDEYKRFGLELIKEFFPEIRYFDSGLNKQLKSLNRRSNV